MARYGIILRNSAGEVVASSEKATYSFLGKFVASEVYAFDWDAANLRNRSRLHRATVSSTVEPIVFIRMTRVPSSVVFNTAYAVGVRSVGVDLWEVEVASYLAFEIIDLYVFGCAPTPSETTGLIAVDEFVKNSFNTSNRYLKIAGIFDGYNNETVPQYPTGTLVLVQTPNMVWGGIPENCAWFCGYGPPNVFTTGTSSYTVMALGHFRTTGAQPSRVVIYNCITCAHNLSGLGYPTSYVSATKFTTRGMFIDTDLYQ